MKSMATSFLGRQIIGQVSAFRKSSERKPIKIQQHVYNDWSAMFKNNTKTYCGVFFSICNYSSVCFRVLILGFYFYHEFASVFQWSFLSWFLSSQHVLVQSQQWKHQNNKWNLFKVNNKDTRTTNDVFDIILVSFFIVNCEQILHIFLVFPYWHSTSKCRLARVRCIVDLDLDIS